MPEGPRITFPVLSLLHHGGVRVLIHIMNHLAHQGYRVQVVVPGDRYNPAVPLDPAVHRVTVPPGSVPGRLGLLVALRRIGRALPPSDALVANFFPTFYPARAYARRHGVPLLYYVQDREDWFYPFPLNWWARRTYQDPSVRYLFASTWLRNTLGLPGEVVPPGVEGFWPDPDPELMEAKGSRRALLYLWRRERRKGAHLFLEALRHLEPPVPLEVWIVGKVSPERLALPRNLPFRVLGYLDRHFLRKVYSSADLFVHTSLFEGFGLPPLEAMACGVPVVLTDSGGVREFVRHGENAWLVDQEPAAIARGIHQILTRPDLQERLRTGGLQTARAFPIQRTVQRFETVLQRVLNRG